MIEAVKAKYGEAQAFEKMGIDKTTYYNYKKGGNPNRKKVQAITDVFNRISNENQLSESEAEYIRNHPLNGSKKESPDSAELMRRLIDSQEQRIKLLEERQQAETRLIQVEETLKIVVRILNDLKIPDQHHKPSDDEPVEIKVRTRDAGKSESTGQTAGRK